MNKEQLFEKIFKENFTKVQHFVYSYLKDREAAENVAQEAFMRLWNNWDNVDTSSDLLYYLLTIAKNYSLNLLRKQNYQRKYIETKSTQFSYLVNYGALRDLNPNTIYTWDIQRIMENALQELSPAERETFTLRLNGRKSNKEIAAIQNISVKTVEARITKTLKILRKHLNDYLPFILGFLLLHVY